MSQKHQAVTLIEWANIALAKHSRKIFKYEARVVEDKDPEDLHQMRVGIRRLRSALIGFSVALDLPLVAIEKDIAKIGRSLGKLRDLDVLLAKLKDEYRPLLPLNEQNILDSSIKSLQRKRRRELKQVRKTLNSKLYFHFEQQLKSWLARSTCKPIGRLLIFPLLPELLLPQISQFLLHPGWLVGTKIQNGIIQYPQMLNKEALGQIVSKEDYLLHELRKSAKKTRYNLELFAPLYGQTYHDYLGKIEQIQEVLGEIQDIHVLKKKLENTLGRSPIASQLPRLAELLLIERYQKWLEWEVLQREFLQDQTRIELRQAVQQPLKNNAAL
ncbi:MAG: CHAD domain-containing protein [Cyanobacteria bacterium P01_A01_bin.83]